MGNTILPGHQGLLQARSPHNSRTNKQTDRLMDSLGLSPSPISEPVDLAAHLAEEASHMGSQLSIF